ncbi:class I adenylate-forming enzyme family protein [Leisingera thetidis]|uniref:class I adenylate-forming enzyme family protein n=1 Tax=Leisingera thetidis TaxID=2930199 RepID=UPI0021F77E12|nr:class I adenylate-forming enzyme family protein [Leisingera thetidis]
MHDPAGYHRVSEILSHRFEISPDRLAVEDASGTLTYAELHTQAARLALELAARGIRAGDRVFLLLGNSREFAAAFWAVQLAGAVAVPLPVEVSGEQLDWMVQDCEPRLILSDAARTLPGASGVAVLAVGLADAGSGGAAARPPGPALLLPGAAAPDDLALMIYTSGSTGKPKGVMLSQKNVITAACSVATYLGYQSSDRIFCAIPFTFDYGLHQLTTAALAGACVIAERDFSQPFLSLNRLALSAATVLPLVPTLGALVTQIGGRFDLSSLRILTNTAAALSTGLIEDLRELVPQARLFSMYGLTECHRCTYLEPDQLDRRKTSVGKAIPFTRMWVVDEQGQRRSHSATGELVIAGGTVMQGYWRRPDATRQRLHRLPETGETVFHTGDICRLDAEGYCYFIGRVDDILKVRGQKVAPLEVERHLLSHPKIAQAAVLGRPDPVLGTALIACIEPVPGAQLTAAEVLSFAAQGLPVHARPVRVQIERALPRNGNGKIDKRAIRLAEPAA